MECAPLRPQFGVDIEQDAEVCLVGLGFPGVEQGDRAFTVRGDVKVRLRADVSQPPRIPNPGRVRLKGVALRGDTRSDKVVVG